VTLQPHDDGGYTHADDPGEPRIGLPRISISDREAKVLSALAYGRVVFEIGTGLGVSTRALAAGAEYVVTYDIDPWVQGIVWRDLRAIGVECVTDLSEVADLAPNLVFIDADHATAAVRKDVEFAESIIDRPGIIVAHDTRYEQVVEALKVDEWTLMQTEHGLGIKVCA
jgi:predicted O-methyltransferase YrrM